MNKLVFCWLLSVASLGMAFVPASGSENKSETSATTTILLEKKRTTSQKEKFKPFKAIRDIQQLKKALQNQAKQITPEKESIQISLSKDEKKQLKKQLRKSLWKSLTKKDGDASVHWASLASLISGAGAVGILGIGLAVGLASSSAFSFLIPFALLLALFGLVTAFVGIFKSSDERFRGGMTLTYSIIGGILSFLYLAFVALVIIAIASISF